nr:unnamed protein product [Spirometra erinaceieuropaei]
MVAMSKCRRLGLRRFGSSSQTSRNSAYTEGHRNPTLIRGHLSTSRHCARGSSPVFSHIFCAIGRLTLVLEILPRI